MISMHRRIRAVTDARERHTRYWRVNRFHFNILGIPVNPPPLRGSLPRKSLISRMDWVSHAGDINLPHIPFPPAWSPPTLSSVIIFVYNRTAISVNHRDVSQGSRWRAKKTPCGCSLHFVLVPKEKWKSPCNFTKSLC
jgi:hypothetical protein